MSGIPVFGLVSDPGNPARLLIATGGGGYRSDDAGTTWEPASGLDPITTQANLASFIQTSSSIIRAPSDPNVLYLERQSGLFEHQGLWRSRDGGITWQAARQELQGSDYLLNGIRTLTVDPANPDQIYAGIDMQSKPSDQPPYSVRSGGIYRSSDGGDTWQYWGNGLQNFAVEPQVQSIVFDPKDSSTLYAGAVQNVFKSTDGGIHWRTARRGLGTLGANILAIDPSDSRRLFAGTRRGVYGSQDSGRSWLPLNRGLKAVGATRPPEVFSLVIDPDDSKLLYAATSLGVFASASGGRRWEPIRSTLGEQSPGQRLALTGGTPKRLYGYAPAGGGVMLYQR